MTAQRTSSELGPSRPARRLAGRGLGVAALALLAVGPRLALAQPSVTTGLPVGDAARLHAKLELGVAYDSNPGRLTDAARDKQDGRMMVRPGLQLVVPGTKRELRLYGNATINQYFNAKGRSGESTFLGMNAGGELRLGTDTSKVQLRIRDDLTRTPVTLDAPGGLAVDERASPLWYNTGELRLTLRPSGPALAFDLGYHNRLTIYDDLPNAQLHTGLVEARWAFLPKTSLFVRGEAGIYAVWDDVGRTTSDAVPVEGVVGLKGLVTPRLTTEVSAGWSDMLTDRDGVNTSGPIATAMLTYLITDYSQLTIGYHRMIRPAVVVNSYRSDAPFARAQVGFGARFLLIGEGRYEWRSYAPLAGTGNAAREKSTVLSGDIRAEYWVFEFLRASVGYRMMRQELDTAADRVAASVHLQDFTRHQVYFNLGFEY